MDYQAEVDRHGGISKAARVLGIPKTTFIDRLRKQTNTPETNKLNRSVNPKILFYDIETAPMVVATWGLFDQTIQIDSIIQDWYIICACWKWAGSDKIYSVSVLQGKDHRDDYAVCKALHDAISEADIIVAQNGDNFDMKKLMARAIAHGLPPIGRKPSVDTLKEARRVFKFSSNKLDYIGQFLEAGAKMVTEKGLWMKALDGHKPSIRAMVDYCKQDVVLLERVYEKMRPYMQNHPNVNLWQKTEYCCPNCGSPDVARNGFRYTAAGVFQKWVCRVCGAVSKEGKNLKHKPALRKE
jgi:uncharacterized protein YprB with RNaseH-like and TPR domain